MTRSSATPARRIPDEFLHVYAQYIQHSGPVIRGTRPALLLLKQAIDDALASGEGKAELFATDGEGYRLVVIASSTVAGIGHPEYVSELEQRGFKREALRWGELNVPARHWDDAPDDETAP